MWDRLKNRGICVWTRGGWDQTAREEGKGCCGCNCTLPGQFGLQVTVMKISGCPIAVVMVRASRKFSQLLRWPPVSMKKCALSAMLVCTAAKFDRLDNVKVEVKQ